MEAKEVSDEERSERKQQLVATVKKKKKRRIIMANANQADQPAVMQEAQLIRIIAAARGRSGTHKVPMFSSADPTDWSNWRTNFEIAVGANGWTDKQAREECAMRMTGTAKTYTANVDVGLADPVQPFVQLLDRYQAFFLPPARSSAARAQVMKSKQREDEALQGWHARLRALYLRAFPNRAADLETDAQIIDQFVMGIADPRVRWRTKDTQPATYQAALDSAGHMAANTELQDDEAKGGAGVKKEAGVAAVGDSGSQGGKGEKGPTCFACRKRGHLQRDCPIAKRILAKYRKENPKRLTTPQRGGRGGGFRGTARGASRGRPGRERERRPYEGNSSSSFHPNGYQGRNYDPEIAERSRERYRQVSSLSQPREEVDLEDHNEEVICSMI